MLILIGILSGVLGGMGMGGGTVMIPLVDVFTDLPIKSARLYNLICFVPIVSVAIYLKNGLIGKKGLLPLIASALIFSALGALLSAYFDGGTIKKVFGAFAIVFALFFFFRKNNFFTKRK